MSHKQYVSGTYEHLKGYGKIDMTCRIAERQGIKHCWVDTICIDKSSSAELSEAINSMFRWYQRAEICYVYLSDLVPGTDWAQRLENCRWSVIPQAETRAHLSEGLLDYGKADTYSQVHSRMDTARAHSTCACRIFRLLLVMGLCRMGARTLKEHKSRSCGLDLEYHKDRSTPASGMAATSFILCSAKVLLGITPPNNQD